MQRLFNVDLFLVHIVPSRSQAAPANATLLSLPRRTGYNRRYIQERSPPGVVPVTDGIIAHRPEDHPIAIGRIDSHCHFFNGRYAFREALAIGWDCIRGCYPRTGKGVRALTTLTAAPAWKAEVKYLASLFAVIRDDCEQNYAREEREFRTSRMMPASLITTPLMMDIYFPFADPSLGYAAPTQTPTEGEIDQFRSFDDALASEVIQETAGILTLRGMLPQQLSRTITQSIAQMRAIARQCEAELETQRRAKLKALFSTESFDYAGMPVSWGYHEHLKELLALQRKHPDRVYPFLAVDPRRPNTVSFLEQGRTPEGAPFISKTGPFYGVKVYPPLGYYPDHDELKAVYRFCLAHDLPVTAHCQMVSFYNPFSPEDYRLLADPIYWARLLQQEDYANLRLNLAHFGGEDSVLAYAEDPHHPDAAWTRTIVALLHYPNVYTDTSSMTKPGVAEALLKIITREPHVGHKLLFGTDYVMCMLHEHIEGELTKYFNLYAGLGEDQLYGNAVQFLGVPGI